MDFVKQREIPEAPKPNKYFLLTPNEVKLKAFDYIASKDNGNGLSVEAETAVFEFVKFILEGRK